MLLRMVLGLLPVDEIETFALEFPVDESTSQSGEDLLSFGMADRLAICCLVIFPSFGGLVCSSTTNELMGNLGLVLGLLVVIVILARSLIDEKIFYIAKIACDWSVTRVIISD